MKYKIKQELQDRYDNLSIADRNAYEKIIERNNDEANWLGLPLEAIKLMTLLGLFLISISIILGTPIELFKEAYLQTLLLLIYLTFIGMVVGIILNIFNNIKLNKLKRKLLNR